LAISTRACPSLLIICSDVYRLRPIAPHLDSAMLQDVLRTKD
jgi:hypothetical protein